MKTLDTRSLNERLEELENEFNSWKDGQTAETLAKMLREERADGQKWLLDNLESIISK